MNAVVLVLAIGTCGFMWVEGWDFWKSLFFTIITLSTVGYSDYGLSEAGLRFTAVLIVVGLGVVTFSISQIAPIVFNEASSRERAMKKRISKLTNHVIVCGLGRVGQSCCQSLAHKGVPFVCVDTHEDAVAWAIEHGYPALQGDATSDDALTEAGVRWARGAAVVTESDTENIVITLGMRELNPELFIISRAEAIDAFQKMQRAGATRVISPVHAGGESIAEAIANPLVADLFHPEATDALGVEVSQIAIDDTSGLAGRTIRECGERNEDVVFIAVAQPEKGVRIHPAADLELRAGDILVAAGDPVALGRLRDAAFAGAADGAARRAA